MTEVSNDKSRLLIVDDGSEHLREMMAILGDIYVVVAATSGEKALELAVRKPQPNLILLDIKMTSMDAYEILQRLKADSLTKDIPVIIFTSVPESEGEAHGLMMGATDYMAKPFDIDEVRARIRTHLELTQLNRFFEQTVEQRTAKLRENESQLSEVLRIAKVGYWGYEFAADEFVFNDQYYSLHKITVEEAGGYRMSSADFARRYVHPEDAAMVDQQVRLAFESVDPNYFAMVEARILTGQGEIVWVEVRFKIEKDAEGHTTKLIGINQDITERKLAEDVLRQSEEEKRTLESQLHQSQKIESIGQLAGGVAHDFNNMLGVILGHAELGLTKSNPASACFSDLEAIRDAAKRSADLTRQLLTFARKQVISPTFLDLNEAVKIMLKMLQRLIGEEIQLSWNPATDLWLVNADPSQIDQILANLCVNARDAISGTGRITIKTVNSNFDEKYCASRPFDVLPGDYVCLSVSDDGCGMDKNVQDHIFEPFYTTKDIGSGTGLGLATVYGAVKQNNGFITFTSESGLGTVFNIYLPRVDSTPQAVVETEKKAIRHGSESILLVEDEDMLLQLLKGMLEESGYTVLPATTPDLAISLAQEHPGPIQLLISDLIMPLMNGKQLSEELKPLRPEMKSLFISGYTADIISDKGVIEEGVHFLQKPFSFEELTAKVRDVLDSP